MRSRITSDDNIFPSNEEKKSYQFHRDESTDDLALISRSKKEKSPGFVFACPAEGSGRFLLLDESIGAKINFHPHLHFPVTEGGVDEARIFHRIPRLDDARLAELFACEVVSSLVCKELLSPEWTERLLSWKHTGFNVHSRVRAKTKKEAEQVGKYMIRPLLSLERLSLDEREGQIGYRYGKEANGMERMGYLEFIARTTSHIPDKGQVTVRYYGLYANAQLSSLSIPTMPWLIGLSTTSS